MSAVMILTDCIDRAWIFKSHDNVPGTGEVGCSVRVQKSQLTR